MRLDMYPAMSVKKHYQWVHGWKNNFLKLCKQERKTHYVTVLHMAKDQNEARFLDLGTISN